MQYTLKERNLYVMRKKNKNETLYIKVKELRDRTGLSQAKFGEMFGIPAANIQKWEQQTATPPDYIIGMMERILDMQDEIYNLQTNNITND